jgi:hypothetical protein
LRGSAQGKEKAAIGRVRIFVCIVLAVRFPLFSSPSRPSAWADVSLVHDGNVFETEGDAKSDASARLMFQCAWKRRSEKGAGLRLSLQGAVEAYGRYSKENRSLGQAVTGFSLPLNAAVSAGCDSDVRFKTFFETSRGYAFYKISPFLLWRMGRGFNGTAFFAVSRLDFIGGRLYDYSAHAGGIRVDWAAASAVVLSLQHFFGEVLYSREAYGLSNRLKNSEQWDALGLSQKDSNGETSVQFEWSQWLLLRGGIGYEVNRSNSYGYAFNRPKVNVLAVKSLAAGWTLGLFWTSQIKRYSDSLRPILQISPESENEENNCVLIDATKNLGQTASVKFQAGLYRNESPFRNLYYQKILYSVGLTRRF